MTYNEAIQTLESQLKNWESMIAEPNGVFSKSEITRMFKNNSSSAIANGINAIRKAVEETCNKVNVLTMMESKIPHESHITNLKRRFTNNEKHFLSMIDLMEEWKNVR